MKEIIYLDTDLIHSYLAQINNGLTGDTTNERGQAIQEEYASSKGSTKTTSGGAVVRSGKVKVPLVLETPDGEVEVKVDVSTFQDETSGTVQTEDGREIISKRLHDNALTNLEDYLQTHSLIKTLDESEENEYVMFQSPFQVFNINYLKTITNPEAMERTALKEYLDKIDSLKAEKQGEIDKASNTTQKNIIKREYDKAIKPIEEIVAGQVKEYNYLNFLLDYLETILPTKTFVRFDNSVALCQDQYLRENPNILMFKYPNKKSDLKLTVLGKKTRKINPSAANPTGEGENFVFDFISILDDLITKVGIGKEDDYIISPIAIYFE